MEPIQHYRGNLLDSDATFIVHQCNCVVKGSGKGLAFDIFKRFPDANIYAERMSPSTPGFNVIRGRVVNMLAQYYPGQPRGRDGPEYRLRWFEECLERLGVELPLHTTQRPIRVAFPWRIGCGLGGGSWVKYLQALRKFATKNANTMQVEVYQLSDDTEPVPLLKLKQKT